MNRRHWAVIASLLAIFLVATGAGAAPQSGPSGQAVSKGMVFALAGTPHLWVADDAGVLHWVGDTRALAGQVVEWNTRRELSLVELRALVRGDPWLSAGLVKLGEPIYLAKWEASDAAPTLLHIQSLADVDLFGINANNYGALVLDQTAWDQRFGMASASLPRGVLQSASGPTATPTVTQTPTPVPTSAPTATAVPKIFATFLENRRTDGPVYETASKFEVRAGAQMFIKVTVAADEYNECIPKCETYSSISWGPQEIGKTDANGRLLWEDIHRRYRFAKYTFEDPNGEKVTVEFYDIQ